MTRRNRSRHRNRKPRNEAETEQDLVEEEDSPRKLGPGTVVVDQETLTAMTGRVDPEGFRDNGYRCNRCDYVTRKRGLGGIQALRAHSRVHVRDRRSVQRPLKIQGAVLLISAAIATVWLAVDPAPLIGFVPTFDLSGWHGPALAVGVPAALLAYTCIETARFYSSGQRGLVKRVEAGVLAGDMLVLAAALTWPLLTTNGLHWAWLIPTAVPAVVSGTVISPAKNFVLLAVGRRKFVPRGYRRVLKAATEQGDDQVDDFKFYWERRIRDGRILLDRLSRAERELLSKLGLSGVRPDEGAITSRLRSESGRNGIGRLRPPVPRRAGKPTDDRQAAPARQARRKVDSEPSPKKKGA